MIIQLPGHKVVLLHALGADADHKVANSTAMIQSCLREWLSGICGYMVTFFLFLHFIFFSKCEALLRFLEISGLFVYSSSLQIQVSLGCVGH